VEPPYRQIAEAIAARIVAGELVAGDRVPSTRQIVERYQVAMATATKALTELRVQGLVQAEPGVGTVVAAPPARKPRVQPQRPSMRDQVVEAAIRIADAEGQAGLSMRRLAGELGVPTMSLYRQVADKEELLLLMMDRVFAANPPPDPAPEGWRARIEALSRLQWAVYRRHPWLAQAMSFTRPLLAPRAMAHTEWAMRALDGHGLDGHTLFLTAVMVANYVRGTAVNLEAEAQAEQDTGLTDDEWMQARQDQLATVLASGDLPMIARYVTAPGAGFDLDELMEYGLRRILDGLAVQLSARTPRPPRSPGSA
jgi:DNA-binding transcriptional regulator YhcF (GntR family)